MDFNRQSEGTTSYFIKVKENSKYWLKSALNTNYLKYQKTGLGLISFQTLS